MLIDTEENQDVFYKDIPDGISSLSFGEISKSSGKLVIVGGSYSIQGFDHEGEE